jgi:hypothetical protein
MTVAPQSVYIPTGAEPLGDLRMLVPLHPELLYGEASELAQLFDCSEAEAQEAWAWVAEDGLEVVT